MGGVPVVITDKGVPVSIQGDIPASSIPMGSPGDPAGPLDASGKIPTSQLPVGDVNYIGNWNATTNTPTLAAGVGTAGDMYICDVAGTQSLGNGSVAFAPGDWVIYDGAAWDRVQANGVTSANPSVSVGLTAKNGSAATFMRSDGAPALDQSIVPTWTGKHTFTNSGGTAFTNALAQTLVVTNTGTTGPTAIISTASSAGSGISTLRVQSTHASAGASLAFHSTALGTDLKTWDIYQGGTTLSFRTSDDANSTNATWLTATRAGNTIAGITSDSGSGQWGHTGNFSASGAVAGNTTVTAGIGSNSVQMVGAASGQDVKIRALGVSDANVSIELSAKGTGLLKMASPTTVSGAFTATSTVAVTGAATFGGNVAVAGQLGSANNTNLPSPTNSGIILGGAPTWAMMQMYDQSLSANNRSADMLFISQGIKFRFANDARNGFVDALTINGGQALGVTGITSTSGSGAWAHTGQFSVTIGGTPRFTVTSTGDLQAAANYIPATPDSLVTVSSVPLRVSADGKTSQAANVNVPALYAVPTSGLYRVSSYIVISQAATTSSTMPSVTVTYTDATTNTALSELMTNTATGNTVGTHLGGYAVISAQQGSNIGYVTSGYASSGATPMQYAVHMKIEFLG